MNVLERYRWKRVEAPKHWRPTNVDDELVGFYGGKTQRSGQYGDYEVVLVHVPARGAFMISGTRIVQLIDAAGIESGWPVRVVWRGLVRLTSERKMKDFAVYVAEGDPVAADDLPAVREDA